MICEGRPDRKETSNGAANLEERHAEIGGQESGMHSSEFTTG